MDFIVYGVGVWGFTYFKKLKECLSVDIIYKLMIISHVKSVVSESSGG